MKYIFTKDDQVAGGKIQGVRSRDAKTGIHSIPPDSPEHKENSWKGGITQGNIQGVKNRDSGQIEQMSALPQSVKARLTWATSEENKEACRKMGSLQGIKVDWARVKTKQSCQKGAEIGGPRGRHVRWHVNRHVFNMSCDLCLEAIARKENWGIEVFEPEN